MKLGEYGSHIEFSKFSCGTLLALLVLTVTYGTAKLLLALAWRDLLKHFGIVASTRWVVRTYDITQLAKYVPGNILHLASRQAIGQAAGLPPWPVAKSAVWELGLMSAAGSLFAVLVVTFFLDGVTDLMALSAYFAAVGVTTWSAYRWVGPWMALGLGWYVVFLALSSICFFVILSLVVSPGAITDSSIVGLCGAYVVAWLAGLVTPAPLPVSVYGNCRFLPFCTRLSQKPICFRLSYLGGW